MKKIGITGQFGFVGRHLSNNLGLFPTEFQQIHFDRSYFDDSNQLDAFVSDCDVIVHLAALNRHDDEQVIYDTNISLSEKLVAAFIRTGAKPHVLVSSSTQEERDNVYGRSKKIGRELLVNWAEKVDTQVTGFIIPNVFGAFGKPFYNSFIATFCHQLTHGEQPTIAQDGQVQLIYVQELVEQMLVEIRQATFQASLYIQPTAVKQVSTVLALLQSFQKSYFEQGIVPVLADKFELDLFNTFCTFIDHRTYFPVKFQQHIDPRGMFVEVIRMGVGGQSSYSTTVPGITRGNHFHTRKIERFAVIKGKALIQLRKIDSDVVLDFYLDGTEPAYVDMPIWYTHNIKNIGDDELITLFWINEPYNPVDPDTYFVTV